MLPTLLALLGCRLVPAQWAVSSHHLAHKTLKPLFGGIPLDPASREHVRILLSLVDLAQEAGADNRRRVWMAQDHAVSPEPASRGTNTNGSTSKLSGQANMKAR